MKNIVLYIEYDGTRYYGWQKQAGLKTIQETIEKAIERVTEERVTLVGSGRTDKGVHARGQVANFKINKDINIEVLKKALNALLPLDIRIKKIEYRDLTFHARFSAKKKVYYYYFSYISFYSPIFRNYVWYIPQKFNIDKMRYFAKSFIGTHDFSSFRNLRGKWETNDDSMRTVFYSDVIKVGRGLYIYRVCGNGFFYKMVRNMFGLIYKVGINKITIERGIEIFKAQDRKIAPPPVPSHGLFLVRVVY